MKATQRNTRCIDLPSGDRDAPPFRRFAFITFLLRIVIWRGWIQLQGQYICSLRSTSTSIHVYRVLLMFVQQCYNHIRDEMSDLKSTIIAIFIHETGRGHTARHCTAYKLFWSQMYAKANRGFYRLGRGVALFHPGLGNLYAQCGHNRYANKVRVVFELGYSYCSYWQLVTIGSCLI